MWLWTFSHLMTLLPAPPANLRIRTVSGAVPLFPAVVTLLWLGTLSYLMSWLSAPSAHLWLWAVRGTMAHLSTIVATFRFGTIILHVAFFATSSAYFRLRTVRSHVAFLWKNSVSRLYKVHVLGNSGGRRIPALLSLGEEQA